MSTASNIELAKGAISLTSQILTGIKESQVAAKAATTKVDKAQKIQDYINIAVLIAGLIPQARIVVQELIAIFQLFKEEGVPVPSLDEVIAMNEELKNLPDLAQE